MIKTIFAGIGGITVAYLAWIVLKIVLISIFVGWNDEVIS